MTKRNGIFDENAPKKLKVDDSVDALWGEDLDEDDVEDCLLLATQICEQNDIAAAGPESNVSVLPNYSFFGRNGGNLFTSTQCNDNATNVNCNKRPTTSKFTLPPNDVKRVSSADAQQLQKRVEALQADRTAKDGEISILRIQLKQIRGNLEAEHQKKEREWTEKVQLMSRELLSTRSELDFKNLEVVNLKNKISEVTRNCGDLSLNGAKVKAARRGADVSLKLDEVLEEQYPLRNKIDPSIFMLSKREHFHISCKSVPSKLNTLDDGKIVEQHKANAVYNDFELDSAFLHISALMSSSRDELSSDVTREAVAKILFAALEITKRFHKGLVILEDDIQEESIRQRDLAYLDRKHKKFRTESSIFGNDEWFENEIGVKCRRIISVLAETLPYSVYLRQLISQRSVYANDTFDNFFCLVQSVIKTIGVLRISERCVGFLCSVVIFMTKAATTPEFCNWYVCIGDIIKEILFTRPPRKTLECLSEFLKQSSLHLDFVTNICRMEQSNSYPINSNQGVLFYNEESCLLRLFTILYTENFVNNQINHKTSMAILQFIKQVLNSNVSWTHYNDDSNHCNCLRKIVKIGIKIIYETARSFIKEIDNYLPNKETERDHQIVLKFSIDLLNIIKFKRTDIFNKYSVISQYKFVMNTMKDLSCKLRLSDEERETLKELKLRKEAFDADDAVLDNVPIWN